MSADTATREAARGWAGRPRDELLLYVSTARCTWWATTTTTPADQIASMLAEALLPSG